MNGKKEVLTIEEKVQKETITAIPDNVTYKDPVSEEYLIWRDNRRGGPLTEWANIDKARPLNRQSAGFKMWPMIFIDS